MKLTNMDSIKLLKDTVAKCDGEVWLMSQNENYNIKSAISFIVAVGKVLSGNQDLELFTSKKSDEVYFLKMFDAHPEMI